MVRCAAHRLILTDGIAITDIEARVRAGSGLEGSFGGRINGGAPITGQLVPARGRTAVRVTGADAGLAAREAGLFKSATGGLYELILNPAAGERGYDGRLRVDDIRLRDQPVIVSLLDAVSIIGLLDPLGLSQGIRADANWNGIVWELYGFIALFFFVFCFGMSRYSMYLERKLQTGHR